ncbi:MAG: hypothetical protein ACTSR3_14855 [Candidatus Helarchaeota archaeon]
MENNNFEIQKKIQKVEKVKENFKREILKKIGDVLISEIGKIIEASKNNSVIQKCHTIKIMVPNFLKFMFNLFNKDNLLNETVLLYILLNFNQLTPELEKRYDTNIQRILKILNESSEIKDLIIINSENVDNSQFLVDFKIPEEFNFLSTQLGNNYSNCIIYGVLALAKWLGLLSPKYQQIYNEYEANFQNYFKN